MSEAMSDARFAEIANRARRTNAYFRHYQEVGGAFPVAPVQSAVDAMASVKEVERLRTANSHVP